MASSITHTGVGQVSNTNGLGYAFSFATLNREDIQVEVIDPSNTKTTKTVTTHYTIESYLEAGSSNAHIKFVSETARGFTNSQTTYKVRISRQTPAVPKVNFTAGSSITASDLNTQGKQAFHLSEENRDSITSLAAGDASGAIQISGSNIADNSITTSKILDLEVGTSDLANNAVTTAKITDLNVTTAKIADDAVTTDKLANSINTTIAGKANTGANLSTFTNDTNYITLAQVPASFVTGMIIMFTGSTAPSGWVFCDNSTAAQAAGAPDLRDRFIVGAGSTYSVGNTGGANTVTLTVNQIPSHDHNVDTYNEFASQHGTWATESGYRQVHLGGTRRKPITSDTGGGQAHENRPPYYALAFIMKT
tara:strand:+ start:1465 stop:2559 length:1095 start_codon:yes stop_codon:yes gene_type:complete